MLKLQNSFFWVAILLFVALSVRIYNFSFPLFTSDEARIAYRGFTLATTGKDELGRTFPLLFNSQMDYEWPATSYITAFGVFLFGKNDFGARIPFILVSLLIVVLIYENSKIFGLKGEFRFLSALIAVFSPVLIFFSKIPNEMIVLTFSITLLFYLLTKKQVNFFYVVVVMIFTLTISKITWWVLVPFTALTLIFFQKKMSTKTRVIILIMSFLLSLFSISLFLQVPQAKRSLLENDFSILQDPGIKITLNRLRGQGIEAGWPNFLEKILYNKFQIATVVIINWLSKINPAILFGQFEKSGISGFISMGAFPKITVIPFLVGLVFTLQKGTTQLKALIFYFLLFTFSSTLVYPRDRQDVLVPSLPILTFIIALGLINLNRFLKYTVLILMIAEVFINIIYLSPQIKHTNDSRPIWIKKIVEDVYSLSKNSQAAISDDFTSDIVPFLQWYTPVPPTNNFQKIQFPYKFHQGQVANIKIIGSDNTFYFCGLDQPNFVFASKRDLEEIQKWLNIDTPKTILRIYNDDLDKKVVYLLTPTICVH